MNQRKLPRGEYGFDAPFFPLLFGFLSAAAATAAAVAFGQGDRRVGTQMTLYFGIFFANTAFFLHATRRGKFIEWERILDSLNLRGDEAVLDIGCGRGAVLNAVARRLTTGRITGIDIWSRKDQSGNAREVTLRNAALEGVSDRVDIQTGDMCALPFPDSSFDVIVSSLAIHNIPAEPNRRRAVAEGFRVLRPGGRLVIADIRATRTYQQVLLSLGAETVERRRLSWRVWWGNPIAATSLVTATKPATILPPAC